MSDPKRPGPTGAERPDPADERERRRRLTKVFGDVLPDRTRDEQGAGWGEREGVGRDDDWFRGEVPPHHG